MKRMSDDRDKLDPKDEQEGHFWGLVLYAVTAGLAAVVALVLWVQFAR
ncbi:MAG TPA: hypothetical protein VFX05_00310 [Casimicrobiaceae bacterium]|nr:hypothetical protein [Casimicrobiaceae bacterium]